MTAEPGVLVTLRGGLGNQLFEYAAALRAMRETGLSTYELLFVESWYSPDITDFIDVIARHPTRGDRARWSELAEQPGPLRPLLRRTAQVHERRTPRLVVAQYSPFAPPPSLPVGQLVKLDTFCQHPGWWQDDWRTVVAALLERAPAGYAELVQRRRTVINLRQRADYIRETWQLPLAYYDRLMGELAQSGVAEVVIQADEPAFLPWFQRLVESAGLRVIDHVDLTGEPARDDFWNLAAGSTLAIPNSTFSWWAAAVATARDDGARVLYPTRWLPNRWTSTPIPDMGLPGWTSLPSHLEDFDLRPAFTRRADDV